MKLGDRVKCDGYIKKTGCNFIFSEDRTECCLWEKNKSEAVQVEGCQSVEKFRIINTTFYGVYVGTTSLCTVLTAEYGATRYGFELNEGFFAYSKKPRKFAVVYYANNKKRLVPLDMIEEE